MSDSTSSPTGAFAPAYLRYVYDGGGRLSSVDLRSQNGTFSPERAHVWNDDGGLRLRHMWVPRLGVSGNEWLRYQYFYDAKGELVRVEQERDSDSTRTFIDFSFTDPFGRRVLTKQEDTQGSNKTFTFRNLYVGQDRVAFLRSSTTSSGGVNAGDGTGRIFVFSPLSSAPLAGYGHPLGEVNEFEENILYHHRDPQGTVVQKTRSDGQVPLTYRNNRRLLPFDFSPFGVPQPNLGTTQDGYTGAPHDNGRYGLVYLRNRYYDPETGRFTQEDPIGFAGGINLYAYAGNNPVNFTDPFGLCQPWPDCWFQGLADWGAGKGGAVGSVALNVGAGLNAASEAVGTNDLGAAIGEGDVGKGALAVATMLPVGRLGKGAKLLRNVDGGAATASQILKGAERWLGRGYKEIAPGVFRSADNTRQFRMTVSDLTDARIGPHVNFEAIGPDGRKIVQNTHVRILPE